MKPTEIASENLPINGRDAEIKVGRKIVVVIGM